MCCPSALPEPAFSPPELLEKAHSHFYSPYIYILDTKKFRFSLRNRREQPFPRRTAVRHSLCLCGLYAAPCAIISFKNRFIPLIFSVLRKDTDI